MAKNKTSGFGVADDLGYSDAQEVQEVYTRSTRSTRGLHKKFTQEVQEVHEMMPSTQGKKGNKMKRINMAFSDENHAWITTESRRRGISATQFVNDLIAAQRLSETDLSQS